MGVIKSDPESEQNNVIDDKLAENETKQDTVIETIEESRDGKSDTESGKLMNKDILSENSSHNKPEETKDLVKSLVDAKQLIEEEESPINNENIEKSERENNSDVIVKTQKEEAKSEEESGNSAKTLDNETDIEAKKDNSPEADLIFQNSSDHLKADTSEKNESDNTKVFGQSDKDVDQGMKSKDDEQVAKKERLPSNDLDDPDEDIEAEVSTTTTSDYVENNEKNDNTYETDDDDTYADRDDGEYENYEDDADAEYENRDGHLIEGNE